MLVGIAELLAWKFVAESTPSEKVEVENEGREVCAASNEVLVASVIGFDDEVGEEGWDSSDSDYSVSKKYSNYLSYLIFKS
jgi:hypothetical protein